MGPAGAAALLEPQARHWPAEATIALLDLPGSGDSDALLRPEATPARHAAFAAEALVALGATHVDLLGWRGGASRRAGSRTARIRAGEPDLDPRSIQRELLALMKQGARYAPARTAELQHAADAALEELACQIAYCAAGEPPGWNAAVP